MSPFDLSVIVFFIAITAKVLTDTFEFWRELDEAAEAAAAKQDRRVRPAVRHLPAPCRPAPAKIAPRTASSAGMIPGRPILTVRTATTASSGRAAGRRKLPNRRVAPAAARREQVAA